MSSVVEEELRNRRSEWMEALRRGDTEAYADLVTEDLVWLPPAREPIRGRAAFRAWLQPFFEKYSYEFRVGPTELRLFDGWCVEAGTFESVLTPKRGGSSQSHGGRYTVLWRLDDQDGRWRIERYVDGFPGADGGSGHEASA